MPPTATWRSPRPCSWPRPARKNPRELAQALVDALKTRPAVQRWVAGLEIAGPGFINLRLTPAAKQAVVAEVLAAAERFGHRPPNDLCVMVEFVSANPTGPLHLGHGRQAALGDAICRLFETQGWQVTREFYYNDAGVQIANLARSVQARLHGLKPGDADWPADAYNGEYIADIAADFTARKTVRADDRAYTASGDAQDLDGIRQFAVAYLRHEQDLDLRAFGVRFDNYFLESSLYTNGRVEQTVDKLVAAGKTYEKDGALWLRSTEYGDDKDRVMRKSDGSYTYFVPDVAYHVHKWERGFAKVVNIQGTDHHGTIARVRAGLQAVNEGVPAGLPRLRAAQDGHRDEGRPGGQDQQAHRRLRHAARPHRMDQPRRGALLPREPQGRHRVRVRRRPRAQAQRREPGVLRAVRARAPVLGDRQGRRGRRRARPTCRCSARPPSSR